MEHSRKFGVTAYHIIANEREYVCDVVAANEKGALKKAAALFRKNRPHIHDPKSAALCPPRGM